MKIKPAFFLLMLLSPVWSLLTAQPAPDHSVRGTSAITGQIWNPQDSAPVEYANVVLYRQRDSSLVNGTVTDAQGRFTLTQLPPGRYYLEVSFIGFRTNRVRNIQLAPDARLDLGRIPLEPAVISMPGVEATAEKPKMEFRIDRKVINVAQNPALQTGTAVDALENAPSVKVDLEGNVSLRGLSSFTVLIDGRPSPLEGSEALRQIPASTIDRIEIVTNPSAKYDPEGRAGIINVILKKQRPSGISGILNLNAGTSAQLGSSLLLSLRTGTSTFFINPNFNQGGFPGTREMSSWVRTPAGDTAWRSSDGTMLFQHRFYGLRAGADLQLTTADWLSLSGYFGGNGNRRGQQADYYEWKTPDTTAETLNYRGATSSTGTGNIFSASLDAGHNFGKKGHDLQLHATLRGRASTDSTLTEESLAGRIRSGRMTRETHQGIPLDLKLDYALPLREKDKFEAGYQLRLRLGPDQNTTTATFDTATARYQENTLYRQSSVQRDRVHALYSTYSASWQGFGAMLGIRAEYSGRTVKINDSTFTPLNRWDFFPSLHLSYSFPQEQQIMASYTRRIDRPGGWDLSPFLTWMDPRNVRQGNPALKPEYLDSYEAGFVLPFGASRLSVDGYYRVTHNVIERFQSIYQQDIILHTVKNIGTDQALGLEMNLDLSPFRFWNISLTGDLYDYRLKGMLDTTPITRTSFNWEAGLTTDLTLPTATRLQLQARYESPSTTLQGKEGGRIWTGVSARQMLFNRQLFINLSVRDLLASSWHENETKTDNFYTWSRFGRKGPQISLGLTWNFNNYKPERRRLTTGEEEEDTTTPIFEY
ncbi:MAG: TonB-dependent receptor [candidate division WOR-3 bacterium]|nr:TonB-dependent receptor [candidate division WOR-3 bacterium]